MDRRPPKKRVCVFCSEQVRWIDYKDADLLRRYMSERAKIRARRVTGNCRFHQAKVASAIRLARELALLPYAQRQVTVRTKRPRPGGPGGPGGPGSRAGGPMPEPSAPPPPPRSREEGEGDEDLANVDVVEGEAAEVAEVADESGAEAGGDIESEGPETEGDDE
ncbi:MAG: 30S ribosomal protein S18 [Actinobacteria bacterium]|nr:30S ribosomal protein S18 [Actinomycetota bacterium]